MDSDQQIFIPPKPKKAKRQMTPEAKQKLVDRLIKAREAKKLKAEGKKNQPKEEYTAEYTKPKEVLPDAIEPPVGIKDMSKFLPNKPSNNKLEMLMEKLLKKEEAKEEHRKIERRAKDLLIEKFMFQQMGGQMSSHNQVKNAPVTVPAPIPAPLPKVEIKQQPKPVKQGYQRVNLGRSFVG